MGERGGPFASTYLWSLGESVSELSSYMECDASCHLPVLLEHQRVLIS